MACRHRSTSARVGPIRGNARNWRLRSPESAQRIRTRAEVLRVVQGTRLDDADWIHRQAHPGGRATLAISNSRLMALSERNVTFRWRDSAHGNKKRLMTLDVDKFLRRLLLHLLPPGFVRIRNFGFLANRNRATTRNA